MKNLRAASCVLLASVLLVATALAQTDSLRTADEPSTTIAAARCAYAADKSCSDKSGSSQAARGAIDDATMAQPPRRGPGPAFGPRGPMGRPAYSQMWQSQPSGRHALIGAVIGGLLGWAVAAKGNAGARATFGIATVGAGLGAAMGLAVPSFPSRSPYFRRWPDDVDDEASSRRSAKPGRTPVGSPQQMASADATSPGPASKAEEHSSAMVTAP